MDALLFFDQIDLDIFQILAKHYILVLDIINLCESHMFFSLESCFQSYVINLNFREFYMSFSLAYKLS